MGFQPELDIVGDLDAALTAGAAHHVLAICREALSNVLKHADATQVWIRISTDPLVLRIEDDGVGIPERRVRSSGLSNISDRATRLGGCLVIERRKPTGTILVVELGPASQRVNDATLTER